MCHLLLALKSLAACGMQHVQMVRMWQSQSSKQKRQVRPRLRLRLRLWALHHWHWPRLQEAHKSHSGNDALVNGFWYANNMRIYMTSLSYFYKRYKSSCLKRHRNEGGVRLRTAPSLQLRLRLRLKPIQICKYCFEARDSTRFLCVYYWARLDWAVFMVYFGCLAVGLSSQWVLLRFEFTFLEVFPLKNQTETCTKNANLFVLSCLV